MKKLISMSLLLILVLGMMPFAAFAGEAPESVTVYVTIVGQPAEMKDVDTVGVKHEAITVTDKDGDGALTINDALYAAHDAKYEGGADAGYASSVGAYGLAIDKLWGIANGSGYGYYLNHGVAMSLSDPVADGDFLTAYVYVEGKQERYAYFDVQTLTAEAESEITLQLLQKGYNEDWELIERPVANATVLVDFLATPYRTDMEGKVTLKISGVGDHVISAMSDSPIVPPVCLATVTANTTADTPDTPTEPEGSNDPVELPEIDLEGDAPKKGCKSVASGAVVLMTVLGAALTIVRKKDEI